MSRQYSGPKTGLSQKLTDFSNFWNIESRRNVTSDDYKINYQIQIYLAALKQAIVSACQQLSQAFIDKSINGVVALNAWYSRMGAMSNICLNN